MSTPWTPGPWVANEASSLKYCSSVEYRSDIPGLSNTVCQVRQSGVLVGASALAEQNANARLIAAAPEMAEALSKIRDDIEAIATGWLIPITGGGNAELWENAAKADLEKIDAILAKIGGAS